MEWNKQVLFFDSKPYDKQYFNRANEGFGFDLQYFEGHLSAQTKDLVKDHRAICVFVNDQIDKKMVDFLKEKGVGLVALRSAGYNNVDLKAAYEKIHVVRVPGYSPHAVAEHATGLMLSLNRKIHKAYYRTRDNNFSINGLLGFDMHGKTLGVVGTGKIGKCLIAIAQGFGMNILAYDKKENEEFAAKQNISYVDLPDLLKQSDIVSLHCPLNQETYHLIDEEKISQMKKGVILINTGRGKLIKTEALIQGLKSGQIGSAGLDVYEEESEYFFEDFSNSMIRDDLLARLLTFPNVLVTSHQGFFTREALQNIAYTTLGNIKEYFQGGYLRNEICYRCDKPCKKKNKERCF